MATFSTRFLGCKVSFADAQAIRERLLADGHSEVDEGGEIQVVNTCCVTHEAVSKSRQAAARASRSARTVYVTGCASNLDGAFEGAAPNVVVTRRTGDEAAAMLRFVADVARLAGLEDYRVIVNVGPRGGQTVFHLHWHVLGGGSLPGFE